MQAHRFTDKSWRLDICRAANAVEPLALGPIIVARRGQAKATIHSPRSLGSPGGEFVTIYFPSLAEGCVATDIHIVDGVAAPISTDMPNAITLHAPYRFLAGILPSRPTPRRLTQSTGLGALRRYIEGLLMLERGRLCDRQTKLAANAIRSLLAAALLPPDAKSGLAFRRRASLLGRVVAHIDAHLTTPQSADSLCDELGCSRSALYRATAEAGGAEQLILERRLIAIRNLLCDPAEQRGIAQIALAFGFEDTTAFNRRFKAQFGVPPGEIRRRAIDPQSIRRGSTDSSSGVSPRP